MSLYTDSAGVARFDCGCYLDGACAFLQWPDTWAESDILKDITCHNGAYCPCRHDVEKSHYGFMYPVLHCQHGLLTYLELEIWEIRICYKTGQGNSTVRGLISLTSILMLCTLIQPSISQILFLASSERNSGLFDLRQIQNLHQCWGSFEIFYQ